MPQLLLFCLVLSLPVGFINAQPLKKIDSLRAVLANHPKADTFRVNRLNELALAMGNLKWPPDNIAQIDSINDNALRLANQLNYRYGQAYTLSLRASLRVAEGKPAQAGTLYRQALRATQRINNKYFISQMLFAVGVYAPRQQQSAYFKKAIQLAEATGKPDSIFATYEAILGFYASTDFVSAIQWGLVLEPKMEKDTNLVHQYKFFGELARVYTNLNEYDQALSYLRRCQSIGRRRHSSGQQGESLTLMGEVYQKRGQLESAIGAYRQALAIVRKKRLDLAANSYTALARVYNQKGDNQQAARYAHQALVLMDTSADSNDNYTYYRNYAWLALSQAFLLSGGLDSALYYGRRCLPMAKEYTQFAYLAFPRDVHQVLAQIYAKRGAYAQAYTHYQQFIADRDQLNSEEVTRKATATKFATQMDRQKGQIALLQKDKQLQAEEARRQGLLFVATIVVVVLLLGLAFVLYRNNRSKQKANALLQAQRDQLDEALTELRDTQTQLIQKEKMASLGELTAGIAHEIQNPLNFVNNFSEVSAELVTELEEEQLKPNRDIELEAEILVDLKENLQKINHHGGRASAIVKGMLEHSRTAMGDKQLTNLNALAEEYLKIAYHGLRAKDNNRNVDLETNFRMDLDPVEVVPQEIGRVLLNLYNNAFYAVREKQKTTFPDYQPRVSVSTTQRDGHTEIRVHDNGTGMPESVKAKIFQPFFTTKPTGEGTGLGLSLSYDIVTKGHGGSLTVESQEGEGTAFVIQLPALS